MPDRRRFADHAPALGVSLAFAFAAPAAFASPARAYLDGARFAAPAIEGGSGGRYFSGAPADGYTCSVCHRGGERFALAVSGLPRGGWEPGRTYDLTLAFPEGASSVGAVIEIADAEGHGQGTMALVPDAELEDGDRCRDGAAATRLVVAAGRQLARVDGCGAARARLRWTAPPAARTDVRLHAAAVRGDGSGDPLGDGTALLVQPLRALGAPEPEGPMLTQRCAMLALGTPRRPPALALAALTAIALAGLLGRRWRRRGRDAGRKPVI
jgi:hypothetical protein